MDWTRTRKKNPFPGRNANPIPVPRNMSHGKERLSPNWSIFTPKKDFRGKMEYFVDNLNISSTFCLWRESWKFSENFASFCLKSRFPGISREKYCFPVTVFCPNGEKQFPFPGTILTWYLEQNPIVKLPSQYHIGDTHLNKNHKKMI